MTIEKMLAQMNAAASKTGKPQPKQHHHRAAKKQ